MMTKFFSSLKSYELIGWVGFVATLSMLGNLLVDWAIVLGWLSILTTTVLFYTTTIEAEYVECEWASFITIPAGLIMIFAWVEPVNYFVWVAGPLALAYGLAEYYAPRYPKLAALLHTEERRAAAQAKKIARLEQLRLERQTPFEWQEPDLPEPPSEPPRQNSSSVLTRQE
jgi:hypothetical protein